MKVSARCMLFKFGENRLILAETINIFSKFKMAAAGILDFGKFAYLPSGIDKG